MLPRHVHAAFAVAALSSILLVAGCSSGSSSYGSSYDEPDTAGLT